MKDLKIRMSRSVNYNYWHDSKNGICQISTTLNALWPDGIKLRVHRSQVRMSIRY